MSELMNSRRGHSNLRMGLLTTASVIGLLVSIGSAAQADSPDSDHPTVWIELGTQLERVESGEEQFTPPFVLRTSRPAPETISPLSVPHAARYGIGGEGKISISPEESDWVFAAAIRYGRSNAAKHVRQQSYPVGYTPTILGYVFAEKKPWAAQFADTQTQFRESHIILDFQAGRDVGLGLFGHSGSSRVNLGVRFAQFTSKSNIMFRSDPDWHFAPKYTSYFGQQLKIPNGQSYHSYYGHLQATRSFHGIGPSLSWNASAEVAGSKGQSEVTLDWGINAALLFGRQKSQTHHQTTAQYHAAGGGLLAEPGRTVLYDNPVTPDHVRSHSAVVPNLGGFAGLSFHAGDAIVSFGYRADFFFGAMDGGIDTRKTYDRDFYGPFATISIGLGR